MTGSERPPASLSEDEQKAYVVDFLQEREAIIERTRDRMKKDIAVVEDPLGHIDPAIRQKAEEEFHRAKGRVRYVSSDGRVRYLTPQQIRLREKARKRARKKNTYFEGAQHKNRKLESLIFNAVAVLLAVVIVWVILR